MSTDTDPASRTSSSAGRTVQPPRPACRDVLEQANSRAAQDLRMAAWAAGLRRVRTVRMLLNSMG
ncbi:hypothetical protein IU510_02590 [Nocardia cyriacigeorgica]|uniref:hypothetical protein n=1 Tax=Nocardia cyriacigeorgica TaxID=135487 RepID=UPI001893F5E6|nr:hypothetical protein [Nocardia cyriacigeorgica]MBF6096967.1 hypothetical protein [Nocardia cyriacigeorgica]MBF6158442.1 hypothetical protein [Nocardia cyriacigeorgica]